MQVKRTETKYRLSATAYGKLCKLLPQMLTTDVNNGDFGYTIRSLYFDSIDNQDYLDKVNGLETRKKIRLRTYGSGGKVKLEIKRKWNTFQQKDSMWLNKEDAQRLQSGDYDCLDHYQEPLAEELRQIMLWGHYRPAVLIEYHRKAYFSMANNTRITLDQGIMSSETDLDLFSDGLSLYPVVEPYFAILEVKSTGSLPRWIKAQLDQVAQSNRAVSKYGESRWFFDEINLI